MEAQYIDDWRNSDKALVKSYIHISVIFELEQRYKRALALVQKANVKAQSAGGADLLFTFKARMTRLQLLLERPAVASQLFLDVVTHEIVLKNFPPDTAGYLSCSLLNPMISRISDPAFQVFAEDIAEKCTPWPQARAAVLLWYARGLFDRLLVQKAKLVLRDAEEAARNSRSDSMLRMALEERLFVRAPQIYFSPQRQDWMLDVIVAIVELSHETVSDEARTNFAKSLRSLSANNPRSLSRLNSVFADHEALWEKQSFTNAVLAMLRVGQDLKAPSHLLASLEAFVRQTHPSWLAV